MENLKEIQKGSQTILKDGRKTFGTVSLNSNPDYNWMLWMKNSFALSGFKSKEDAIKRANNMHNEWKDVLSSI